MLKTLLLLFLFVLVLRYLNFFFKELYAPQAQKEPDMRVRQHDSASSRQTDKGEYIDYEEIK
ncbi:MAG: hypothetical protein SFW35_11330 [Chitinophagales bacterium]|nr:hypothetical protein [Chitinophagales bacterium]